MSDLVQQIRKLEKYCKVTPNKQVKEMSYEQQSGYLRSLQQQSRSRG